MASRGAPFSLFGHGGVEGTCASLCALIGDCHLLLFLCMGLTALEALPAGEVKEAVGACLESLTRAQQEQLSVVLETAERNAAYLEEERLKGEGDDSDS